MSLWLRRTFGKYVTFLNLEKVLELENGNYGVLKFKISEGAKRKEIMGHFYVLHVHRHYHTTLEY